MWLPILIIGLLAYSDAAAARSKRSYFPLTGQNLYIFINQFRQTLVHIIGSEYNETLPLVEKLKADMEVCTTSIETQKETCKTCATNACTPDLGEIIVYFLEQGASPFVDLGNIIGDWKAWNDMGNWFEGAGKGFVSWEGWGDMDNFFDGIGQGFVNWDGWNTLEGIGSDILGGLTDFGKMFGDLFSGLGRRKRALGRDLSARELIFLYRALKKIYGRQNDIDPEARKCMEKCSSCEPFLKPTTEEMVNAICGPELLQLNNTVFSTMTKLVTMFNRCNDTTNLIVTSLSYDPTSLDMSDPTNLKYTLVRINAMCTGGYTEYNSGKEYLLMAPQNSAALMALEYFEKDC